MSAVRVLLVLAFASPALFLAGKGKPILGPRDPIAVDGSLDAGRALTLSEQKPPFPLPDLDDPEIFERRFSGSPVERLRDEILAFAALPGAAICESDQHAQLIATIRSYIGVKRYLSTEFHFRGPRAGQFIDQAWASSEDRRIEAFVQRLLKTGYLRAREISPSQHSFLFDVLVQEFGANACSRS